MAVGTATALAGGALLGSGLLGGSKKSGTQTVNNDPWGPIQPYLLDIAAKGKSLYNRKPFDYTNVSPFTQQYEQLATQRALDPNSLIARSQGQLADTISGRYLTPDSNPYFKNYVDQALGQAKTAFAGQYGGVAGSNLSNSGYQEALAKNLGEVASNAYSNLYNTERQNQLNALQVAPALDFANLTPLAQVGATQDARKEQQYYAPFNDLARYQQAISGGLQFNKQSAPIYTNPAAGALGGALGVAQLGRMVPGLFGASLSPAEMLASGVIPL